MDKDPHTTPESQRGSHGYTSGSAAATGPGNPQQESGAVLPAAVRRVSWQAVIAGTVVALVVHLMLSLLGIGIGATQIDPGAGVAGLTQGLGIGAAVWWIISILIALFIGGWMAGYLSGIPEKRDGAIHGIVTWGLAILLGTLFATTAVGAVTAGAWNVVGGGMAMMGQQEATPQLLEAIEDPEMRAQIEEALAQAQQDVEAVAEDATEVVAQAGIWGFVGLLLAGIVAALGGVVGAMQTGGPTYPVYPGREHRERERERDYGREKGRYDYERERERERAERERAERPTYEQRESREPVSGREEREPGERERLERERAERERAEREREQHGP